MSLPIKEFFAVAFGGAIGSLLRFGLSSWIQEISHHKDYPWGILTVNILGCLVMGILAGIFLERMWLSPVWRAGILIGVLGGFTTFSSFTMDTVTLLQGGDFVSAAFYVGLSVVGCLVATAGGFFITRALF